MLEANSNGHRININGTCLNSKSNSGGTKFYATWRSILELHHHVLLLLLMQLNVLWHVSVIVT